MHAAYLDGVRRFDQAFGELLAGLRARDLLDHVTLIVTADHGEEFGDHGGFYHGLTLYEELLHVPLMIAGPDIAPGYAADLARQVDMAPTIAARFGVAAPASWEGRDLFGEHAPPEFAVAEEDHEGNVLRAIRGVSGRKLILANRNNPRGLAISELYDLQADPGEKTPRDDAAVADALRRRLDETLVASRRQPASGAATRALDADAAAELRSLGYLK
jgi:arylsulfatase A-like enzyme